MGARKEKAKCSAGAADTRESSTQSRQAGGGTLGWLDRLAGHDAGGFVTVLPIGPHGSLQARSLSTGAIKFYWRYTYRGICRREEIGAYDRRLPPKQLNPSQGGGWTLAAAAEHAGRLALLHDAWLDRGGYRAYVDAQERERAAKVEQQADEARASLQALLTAYWEHLKNEERVSWAEVRNGLTLHVIKAHPELCALPARSITTSQIVGILRAIRAKGLTRQVGKVRAWLRAAYAVAATADIDVKVSEDWSRFGIEANPVAATSTASIPGGIDKRPLSADELRIYWRRIARLPDVQGAALRLHLRLGAPRIAQLLRLRCRDIQPDLLTLWDGKGRPGNGLRAHVLPLDAQALKDIALLCSGGLYAFSLDGGQSHISRDQFSDCAIKAVGDTISGFQMKRLRSGVETLLARLQVPKDTRGRLQSHGIGGVQDRHYNGYDYLQQKANALHLLSQVLDGSNPTPSAAGRSARVQVSPTAVARGRLLRSASVRPSLRAQQRAARSSAPVPVMQTDAHTSTSATDDASPDDRTGG